MANKLPGTLCGTIYISKVTLSPDTASLPMPTVRRNTLSLRLRSADQARLQQCRASGACALNILDPQLLQRGAQRGRLAIQSCDRQRLSPSHWGQTHKALGNLPVILQGNKLRTTQPPDNPQKASK